jgi:hypothetical protein
MLCGVLASAVVPALAAADPPAHGLWVWKSPSVLGGPEGAEMLRDFCRSNAVTEVYVSLSAKTAASEESDLVRAITVLHRASIRVEALLSSTDADEPGKSREKLLDEVRGVVHFNEQHSADRFDGVHLDIEPQQRPENKGAGNLRFLPGLVDAYRAVRELAEPAHLTVNADIQNKLLKGTLDERRMLLSAVPRLTLMLYELSKPTDGTTASQKADKVRRESAAYLDMAFQGLDGPALATMMIGLRTPDYGPLLPQMLGTVDDSNHANTHYAGWARHSYNDMLKTAS